MRVAAAADAAAVVVVIMLCAASDSCRGFYFVFFYVSMRLLHETRRRTVEVQQMPRDLHRLLYAHAVTLGTAIGNRSDGEQIPNATDCLTVSALPVQLNILHMFLSVSNRTLSVGRCELCLVKASALQTHTYTQRNIYRSLWRRPQDTRMKSN